MKTFKMSTLLLCSTIFVNCASGPFAFGAKKVERIGLLNVEEAAEMVEAQIDTVPAEERVAHLLLAGEYRRLNGDYKKARAWFQEIAELEPTAPEYNAAILGIAIIDFEYGDASALDRIRSAQELDVPKTLNATRYRLLYLSEMNKETELAQTYKQKALTYAQAHTLTQSQYDADIGSSTLEESDEIESEDASQLGAEEQIANMKMALDAKDWGTVIAAAETFLKDNPDSDFTFLVTAYQERAEAQEPFVNNKIAVFLPFTGTYAPAAQAYKQAMDLALKDSSLQVEFYDTGWTALTPVTFEDADNPTDEELQQQEEFSTAQEALELELDKKIKDLVKKATLEDGCGFLVGPMLTKLTPIAAEAAAAYGIPMMSLSRSSAENIFEISPLIHQLYVSSEQQIETLVKHVMREKEWKTFVAMIPDTERGLQTLETFTQVVTDNGGEVLRHVTYPTKATSFNEEARRLGLKAEKRPSEKELEDDPTIDDPTIDFDAIFIPDNHRTTPLITAALANEKFSIGTFRRNKYATPVGLIGLDSWAHPSIAQSGGQYMQNGIFVSGFWQEDTDEVIQSFVGQFQEEYGRAPNKLHALAYDAILIGTQLYNSPQTSRASVQNSLHTTIFPGLVTGGNTFDDKQVLQRDLNIMTIKNDRLEIWMPPTEEE